MHVTDFLAAVTKQDVASEQWHLCPWLVLHKPEDNSCLLHLQVGMCAEVPKGMFCIDSG